MEPKGLDKDVIRCTKCGACKSVCPVLLELRSEYAVARGKIAVQGQAGDGSLYTTISCDELAPELTARLEKTGEEIFKSTLALGGTRTGEHVIGRVKAKYLVLKIDGV